MDELLKQIDDLLSEGYTVSTNTALLNIDVVYNALNNESYWAQGMPKDKFETAVKNSLCFEIIKDEETVGFARIISDKATFAYLCDVFIFTEHRGKGLGKFLIHTIVNNAELQGLRRWSLATRDAHGLYEQFGFVPVSKPENWMEKYKPYTQQ